MMAEQVELDTFEPPHHKLKTNTQNKLDVLFKEYKTQVAKDETSIGTINTGNSDTVSQKPYPIAMKNYQWGKKKLKSYSQLKSFAAADPVGQHQSS